LIISTEIFEVIGVLRKIINCISNKKMQVTPQILYIHPFILTKDDFDIRKPQAVSM